MQISCIVKPGGNKYNKHIFLAKVIMPGNFICFFYNTFCVIKIVKH